MKFNVGDRVRIVNKGSFYYERGGTVVCVDGGTLPYSVKLDGNVGPMYFGENEVELEVNRSMSKDELLNKAIAILAVDYVARATDKEVAIQAAVDDAHAIVNNIDLQLQLLPLLQQYKESNG